jgi:pre-mRNA-splicing factor 38B
MMGSGSDGSGNDMTMMIKRPNTLSVWGNQTTMNLNPLIHTNIESSPYYTGKLSELKTYHELVDEIYYKVKHLEPWEKV